MKRQWAAALALLAFLQLGIHQVEAWDYEGHRVVNQLALASLPTNFPAFVRGPAAVERTAFLAGEMDRWRNTPDLPLNHYSFPDPCIDMEELANTHCTVAMMGGCGPDTGTRGGAANRGCPGLNAACSRRQDCNLLRDQTIKAMSLATARTAVSKALKSGHQTRNEAG
jgi:hypothetical protein